MDWADSFIRLGHSLYIQSIDKLVMLYVYLFFKRSVSMANSSKNQLVTFIFSFSRNGYIIVWLSLIYRNSSTYKPATPLSSSDRLNTKFLWPFYYDE